MADSKLVNSNKAGNRIDQRIHRKLIVINSVFVVRQRILTDLSSTFWGIVLNKLSSVVDMLIWQMWKLYGLFCAAFDLYLHFSTKYVCNFPNQTYEHFL